MKKHSIRELYKKYILRSTHYIKGEGNKVIIVQEDGTEKIVKNPRIKGLRISINGDNNTIKLHLPTSFYGNSEILIGIMSRVCNSVIEIGKSKEGIHIYIILPHGSNQNLCIKENATIRNIEIDMDTNTSIYIGKNCLFAGMVKIQSGDNHKIIQKSTGEILNSNSPRHPLIIGDHCWIGRNVTLLKNTKLPNNTIVGACSVVTKAFTEEYTALAGNPAREIKQDVEWDY